MNSTPKVPSDAGTDVGTDVGIVVITDVGVVVGRVVITDVGVVVGRTVGTDVGIVVPGVGVAGIRVVSFTISFVSVASGVGLGESGLMHPLSKTIPVTRRIKKPFTFPLFISRTLISQNMVHDYSNTCLHDICHKNDIGIHSTGTRGSDIPSICDKNKGKVSTEPLTSSSHRRPPCASPVHGGGGGACDSSVLPKIRG